MLSARTYRVDAILFVSPDFPKTGELITNGATRVNISNAFHKATYESEYSRYPATGKLGDSRSICPS